MDLFLLQAITAELEPLLTGARLGKVVQLGATDLALDFRLRDGRWLLVSTDRPQSQTTRRAAAHRHGLRLARQKTPGRRTPVGH
jgi:predicted ribosome quality control (RQC) complex YloA/Tae2 family protein